MDIAFAYIIISVLISLIFAIIALLVNYKLNKPQKQPFTNEWELKSSTTLIGRRHNADINIIGQKVSREHAIIERRNRSFFLSDLNSKNATFVNAQPIAEKYELKENDIIEISNIRLLFAEGKLKIVPLEDSSEVDGKERMRSEAKTETNDAADEVSIIPKLNNKETNINKRKSQWVIEDSCIIGRSHRAYIMLEREEVSKEHAKIEKRGDDFYLTDLSKNGTIINKKQIEKGIEYKLNNNDTLRIGRTKMIFTDKTLSIIN